MIKCVLTEWEGRTGKYLALGQDTLGPFVLTSSQIFSRSALPLSQQVHNIVPSCLQFMQFALWTADPKIQQAGQYSRS